MEQTFQMLHSQAEVGLGFENGSVSSKGPIHMVTAGPASGGCPWKVRRKRTGLGLGEGLESQLSIN